MPTEPPCTVEQLGGLQNHFNAVFVAMAHGRQACEYVKHEYVHFGFGFKSMALEKDTIYVDVCIQVCITLNLPNRQSGYLPNRGTNNF